MPREIVLNDDGVSVKGCTIIYAPGPQANEYSALALNPYRGCGHKCAYCWVPDMIRMPRKEFDLGAIPKADYMARLLKDAGKYQALGITEQVLMCFSTDPYHPGDTSLTRECIEVLIGHGLTFCTLTKGGTRALRDLDLFRPERDAFACTLTSLQDDFSLRWERAAALPGDRIEALKRFHEAGIFTWVSLEPTLDTEASLAIVEATHGFVDLYKVGRANYLPMTKHTDWRSYTLRMIDLMGRVGANHYIKRDLQEYLPEGYHNPLRIPQHHGVDGREHREMPA